MLFYVVTNLMNRIIEIVVECFFLTCYVFVGIMGIFGILPEQPMDEDI